MRKNIIKTLFIILDISFLFAIFYISFYERVYLENFSFEFTPIYIKDFLPIIFIIFVLLYYEKIYNYRFDFWQETIKIEQAVILSFFITLTFLALTKTNIYFSRLFILIYFFNLALFLPIFKRIVKRVLFKFNFFKQRVLIIGKPKFTKLFKKELEANWYLGQIKSRKKFDNIVIVSKGLKLKTISKILERNGLNVSNIFIVPFLMDINFAHSNILEYSNIRLNTIQIENRLLIRKNIVLKSIFDKLVAIAIFPIFLALHMVIYILIKRDSKGDIFFKQKRVGKDGKIFYVYKYRTMYEDGDSILKEYLRKNSDEREYYAKYHKYRNDPRVTNIGAILRKSSIDELPQIINILRGDMSLVGPRPYMLNEKKLLKKDKTFILKVKPGITGLWQVSGRNKISFKNRVELEKWYVRNWSIWLDIIILIKTIKVVLIKDGAK